VCGSEADRRETRVDLLEVVVVVGDAQLASVLVSVVVGVADEGALPLLRCKRRYLSLNCNGLTWSWNLFQEKVRESAPCLASRRPS
jgi:hypothetical protein